LPLTLSAGLMLCLVVIVLLQQQTAANCGCRPGNSPGNNPVNNRGNNPGNNRPNNRRQGKRSLGNNATVGEVSKSSAKNNGTIVVGDMVLSPKDVALMKGFRNAMSSARLWPGGKLYYQFGSLPAHQQTQVREALRQFNGEMRGCVTFTEGRGDGNYVLVSNMAGNVCQSRIGREGGAQHLNIGPTFCQGYGVVKHEFIHALGFWHEQMRPDRNDHLNIHWTNIQSGSCSQFELCRGCSTTTAYDPRSIMQYGGTLFSCNGRDTMTLKNGGRITYNEQLTELDKKKIRDLYKCR